jgi:hypothetical protein
VSTGHTRPGRKTRVRVEIYAGAGLYTGSVVPPTGVLVEW